VIAGGDLSCQEVVELVTDYLEGALSSAETARVEQHLNACAGCRTYLDQVRHTIRVVRALGDGGLEPAVPDELLSAFRGWRR
jgi:predicted anti-sigma-YlaC factor YlaD